MARPAQAQRGFSLLELLVALFVVVLITSMVTLTVNSGGQDIQLESMVRDVAEVASFAVNSSSWASVMMKGGASST